MIIIHVLILDYTNETLTRLKKFATLLPNNWLADTPQTLGRHSAEREWISEIN
ncbi:hypothetical protein ACIQZD_14270 [Peribacillus sp. NPDC096447]|uniref:hypothetical protein n=1 Tax=Peribacillus sp. NPDC096447 TaxID=3364394 RepID=UPI0038020AB7